jgi:hypothetical protein
MENILVINLNKQIMIFRFYSNHTVTNRVTVVGEFDGDLLKISVARCSNKDQFRKKKGRAIAENRLRGGYLHDTIRVSEEEKNLQTFLKEAVKVEKVYRENASLV